MPHASSVSRGKTKT